MQPKQKRNPRLNLLRKFALRVSLLLGIVALLAGSIQWYQRTLPAEDYLLYNHAITDELRLYNPRTGHEQVLLTQSPEHVELDGHGRIAWRTEGIHHDIMVMNTLDNSQTPINITQTPDVREYALQWHPAGTHLAYIVEAGDEYTLFVWDGTDHIYVASGTFISGVAWSQDGTYLSFVIQSDQHTNYAIWLWDGVALQNPLITTDMPIHRDAHPKLLWGPDNQLAIEIHLWSLRVGESGYTPSQSHLFIWHDGRLRQFISDRGHIADPIGWNENGQLAIYYGYEVDGILRTDLLIWDGTVDTQTNLIDLNAQRILYHGYQHVYQPSSVWWAADNTLVMRTSGTNASNYFQWDGTRLYNLTADLNGYNDFMAINDDSWQAYVHSTPQTDTAPYQSSLRVVYEGERVDIPLYTTVYRSVTQPRWSAGAYLDYRDTRTYADDTRYIWHPSGTQVLHDVHWSRWLFVTD